MEREFCNGKNAYDKRGAETIRNKRWREDRVRLRLYHCDECGKWHLTHQTQDHETPIK